MTRKFEKLCNPALLSRIIIIALSPPRPGFSLAPWPETEGLKREGATEVTPSIETVARCDGASSLALAGYLSFGLSANLALSERYACAAVNGKQGPHGYPQGRFTYAYLNIRDAIDFVEHVGTSLRCWPVRTS